MSTGTHLPPLHWRRDGRERLEVITELAGHLEETYEALRRSGLPEREALHRALSQVTNWSDLWREICRARAKENIMNPRTSRLWLPSFVTLAASIITLVAVGFLGLQPGPLGSRGSTAPLSIVPGCMHSESCMFSSADGVEAIFGR